MPRILTSTVKGFTGSVTIADPLNFEQAALIEAALELPDEWRDISADKRVYLSVKDKQQLPAVMACVSKWEIENIPQDVTAQTFPSSPRKYSHEFIAWVFREILAVYTGEVTIPNA